MSLLVPMRDSEAGEILAGGSLTGPPLQRSLEIRGVRKYTILAINIDPILARSRSHSQTGFSFESGRIWANPGSPGEGMVP